MMRIFTGRLPFQKTPKAERKEPPVTSKFKQRKPINKVSPKRAAHWRSPEGKAELQHMLRVKLLPCVICGKPGPSEVHHSKSGRYSARKRDGFKTMPLCPPCHRTGPMAFHVNQREWEERNGPDYEYLPVVADMLAGELTP